MAIQNTAYTDLYRAKPYAERVNAIQEAIGELQTTQWYNNAVNSMRNQINKMKAKEKAMFKLIGVRDIQELNARMKEYRKSILAFSGPALRERCLEVLINENAAEKLAFSDAVFEFMNENFAKEIVDVIDLKKTRQTILDLLNKSARKKIYTSQRGITLDGIFPTSFTKEQTDRWKIVLAEEARKKDALDKYPKLKNYIEIAGNGRNAQLDIKFQWLKDISKATPDEAKQLNREAVDAINIKVREAILEMVTDIEDRELIHQIIDHILDKNPYEFFIGKNPNSLVGTFGEIAGLYYMSKFMGRLKNAIEWRGGTINTKGKKPHRDILLDEVYGIQSKNTVDQTLGTVGFMDINLSTLLARLSPYLPAYAKDLIQYFYATLQFNVPYHFEEVNSERPIARPGIDMNDPNADIFMAAYDKLNGLSNDVDLILNLFASTLMYLDYYNRAGNVDSNSLFLLGIDLFVTASQIMEDIIQKFERYVRNPIAENQLGLSIQSYQDSTNPRTIIHALNNHEAGYSAKVLDSVFIRSSYNFSGLYK